MKKYILLLISSWIFFHGIDTSFASTSYTATSGGTECEGQSTNDSSGQKWIPSSNANSLPQTGAIGCIKNGYYAGNWGPWTMKGVDYSCPSSGYASKIEVSGNSYRIYCKIMDNIPPSASEFVSSFSDNAYYKANVSTITITGSSTSGSPINFLETQFEDKNNENAYVTHSVTGSSLSYNEDFSKVDVDNRNDVTNNNYRPYFHKISKACDEAGNCVNDIKTFTYNIYANNVNSSQSSIINNGVDNGTAIADGTEKQISVILKDTFGNNVIPVYMNSNTLLRSVNIKVNFNNDLFLNQYTKNGGSSVFVKTDDSLVYTQADIGNNLDISTTSTDKTNITGTYPLKFKVYTPTANIYDKAIGAFNTNNFFTSVSDIIGTTQIATPTISFKYKPLYQTSIVGSLRDDFFLQGSYQTGSINLSGGVSSATNKNLYIEFGSGALNQFSPKLNLKEAYNTINVGEGNGNKSLLVSNFSLTSYPIKTQTLLLSGTIDDFSSAYFSTHISYELDGKSVVYNSDIIGKNNYWGEMLNTNSTQKGLKVVGKTHSQSQQDITVDQNISDIHILGNIEKASLKKDTRKKAFDIIKSVTPNNGTNKILDLDGVGSDASIWNNPDGVSLQDKKILYFGNLNGGNVVLDVGNTHKFTGKKTIIIYGGNLYIKSNIVNNTANDILGIIVLKDDKDRGGNIYIDPSVTRIDGVLYVDKSMISYDGFDELDGNTSQYILKNQLSIYGTIFSENTIGGSIKDTPICPYYILKTSCTLIEAQKYDLNYLRRYIVKSNGIPLNNGINYEGVYNSSYKYYNFPLVIIYNPLIQIYPPPLFEK